MEATAKDTKIEFGDLADCYRGLHAELLEVDDEAFCPRCGIVVEKKEKTSRRATKRETNSVPPTEFP